MDTRDAATHVLRVPSHKNDAARHRRPSRPVSAAAAAAAALDDDDASDSFPPRDAMAIPGARFDDVPPPLPPPRYNADLAQGIDLAWTWANSDPFNTHKRLAPLHPGSSLHGGVPPVAARSWKDPWEAATMGWDQDYRRKDSTTSTVRSPSRSGLRPDVDVPTLPRKPSSPTTIGQRLESDMQLPQPNFHPSSQAYDRGVLSKIGKARSPSRRYRTASSESPNHAPPPSQQTHVPKPQLLLTHELPSSGAFDPISRWMTSPASASVSPGSRTSWREAGPQNRTSSLDSAAPAPALDPELFAPSRPGASHSSGGFFFGHSESLTPTSQSQRASYDQAAAADAEFDFAGDDSSAFRNMSINEAKQVARRSSVIGTKRRALSPPSDAGRDNDLPSRGTSSSAEPRHRGPVSAPPRSPAPKYETKHGSVSSTSSSVRQNSYASSVSFSVGASSMTSISSFEKPMPSDPFPESLISSVPSVAAVAASGSSLAAPTSHTLSPLDTRIPHRPVAGLASTTANDPRSQPPTRIGSFFICDCCSKKPRKFESEGELRAHRMEKQFICQFCHNRFKNKNEAERHQNSLHLRRNSWSCAAMTTYQAAFYPWPPAKSGTPKPPPTDACGFCGEEFPNLPEPDWNRRIQHLTDLHKFGECNQTKKFYRADHFRQHLKHSHAGQSGKWTTLLENVCVRDELPADSPGMSPNGSDYSPRGPSSLSDPPMGGATIDETKEEI